MAEVDGSKFTAIFQEACIAHKTCKDNPGDKIAIGVANAYAHVASILFDVGVPQVIDILDVVVDTPHNYWGVNLWNELSIEASENVKQNQGE